ncbi:MAG TPA: hypothetical protein VJO32_15840, partial [Ktedonobacteraceae bacterium]|nr:hypothetical protein [Ktedonobacteraceae bacterium]
MSHVTSGLQKHLFRFTVKGTRATQASPSEHGQGRGRRKRPHLSMDRDAGDASVPTPHPRHSR